MKKFLLFVLFLNFGCAFATEEISLNLQKNSDLIASKILYSFILKDNGWEKPEAVKKSKVTQENTFAEYVDLSSDGVSEIVGYSTSPHWDKKGFPLYVLKKDNYGGEYIKVDFILKIDPNKPLSILNDKNKGFYGIRVWDFEENQPTTVKYDGSSYSIMRL